MAWASQFDEGAFEIQKTQNPFMIGNDTVQMAR
jgi:hypothetical protein